MTRNIFAYLSLLLLLFTGCGEKHKAQTVINDFLRQHAVSGNYELEDVTEIDSTFYVTDSMIQRMHRQAAANPMYKPAITYQPRSEKLLFIHVKITQEGKSHKQTFYFDSSLAGVVSFKED